ncbi:caldesmon-like [Montipora capricornis]|uniref:caldesmon-like n=1 Tax=Montipora capricornis TaxID=246305 RepID=UPI0035F12510
MASSTSTEIEIQGDTYSLVSIPSASSQLVKKEKENILGSLDLASLVEDLGKLGNFIRVAYNGVAGYTDIQIKVQRVGYNITKLADKSAVTVHNFKNASQSILEELKGTYEFLLDGMEGMALETLSQLGSVAADMAKDAEELQKEFEKATEEVIQALEATQKVKGTEEETKKTLERKRKEFESQIEQAEEIQKRALEAEENAKALFNEAQAREDAASSKQDSFLGDLANLFTGVASSAASAAKLERVADAIEKIGEKASYKQAMKLANEEKMKHLKELNKQRELRQQALLQCIKFAQKMENCCSDDNLAEVAIEALHSSIGALKSLSAIMMDAASFWHKMQKHCENLAKGDVKALVERAIKEYPEEEKRRKIWTSKPFKSKAVSYYAKWVALDDVCGVYMLQIKNTRDALYKYVEENATIEQAKENLPELAATLKDDLKKSHAKLEGEKKKALEEAESIKDSM